MARGNRSSDVSFLLELVDSCTAAQIYDLVKRAQASNSDLRISGDKPDLIRNLEKAVTTKAIAIEDIQALISDTEESKSQHIFYYRPATKAAADTLNDPEPIAEKLFGSAWREEQGFPVYDANPVGYQWADFRIQDAGDGRYNWTGKIYAGLYKRTRIDTTRVSERIVQETWEEQLKREVYLVRWRHYGILELSIPPEESKKSLNAALDGLRDLLGRGLDLEQIVPLDLTRACKHLIEDHAKNAHIYRIVAVQFQEDSVGSAVFTSASPEDHIMSAELLKKAITGFERFKRLGVFWIMDKVLHGVDGELESVIGRLGSNHLLLSHKSSVKAVRHVTDRLHRLAK